MENGGFSSAIFVKMDPDNLKDDIKVVLCDCYKHKLEN